ncbi:MAG: TetR/AcrR family transcriptional regulator [Bacteroidia bacterium]|jgi:AcrR family transcriptional regulator
MPRSAAADAGTRDRLLQTGLGLMQSSGIKAVTVRATAAASGVNLGSFVYHFGTREAFVGELLERWYAPLFAQLQRLADVDGDSPLARLRGVLLRLVLWVAEHRGFLGHLLLDAGSGDGAALRFVRSMDQRHPALLLQLIGQAQQAGQLQRGDAMHQMLFLLASAAAPLLMLQLLAERGIAPPPLAAALTAVAADPAQIETRLGWALRGLAV